MGKIPLSVKIAYTAFMAVLVPVYYTMYGPTNFVYFCDICLFLTLFGVWTESVLLISAAAIGVIVPQLVWCVDFIAHLFGTSLTGMTTYMFSDSPLFLRGLSLYHGVIPFLLIYLVYKTGYDRRALPLWVGILWCAIATSYFFLPPPRPDIVATDVVNVNYVYGLSDTAPQTVMHPHLWVLFVGLVMTTIALKTHLSLMLWHGEIGWRDLIDPRSLKQKAF